MNTNNKNFFQASLSLLRQLYLIGFASDRFVYVGTLVITYKYNKTFMFPIGPLSLAMAVSSVQQASTPVSQCTYHVFLSFRGQVKKQTGSYAEAFARHEERFRSELNKVHKWRATLKEVAGLAGMVLRDRHESQFIQDIVNQVQNKLHLSALYVPPYLVGVDTLITRINWWIKQDGHTKVGIAAICGIGGIGKTTIAKVVYNQNIHGFEGHSFLANVRETSGDCNGLLRLQRQLISDILKGKAHKIYNTDNGINKIKEVVCCRRVLLVLDDVEDLETVRKLIGSKVPFHPGSKIIITSRHRFLGQTFGLEASSGFADLSKMFEVKELSFNESLQLFHWYAFGCNSMPESFMECAGSLVKQCGGLPLALQVLASSLSGKSMNVWRSALEKLQAFPNSKILKILRISYDSLEDDHDRNLFLDIACLFIGKDRDYTTTILDGCDFYTTIGIENLIGRSLLTINEKNKLMMHQMIRDMGREIIRQESPDVGERSRLWHKDAFDVIREKTGSRKIKCLVLDLQGLLENKSKQTTTTLHLPKHSQVCMETQAFEKMRRLQLLQLDHVKLKGDFKDFPKSLIWLRWHGFPMQSLPADFDIRRLVALDMRYSNLKRVWKDKECVPNLKILNLNHSHSLLKTPNFSGLPSLEKLMLKDCIKLVEVDQSIGELKMLTFLNLKDCKSLGKLPRTIGSLISLEVLILSGCSTLDNVPKELHDMKSLKVLNLDGTSIYQTRLRLPYLLLKRSKDLGFSWASLPCSLVKLSLESCRLTDDAMPHDLCNLASLKSLNLSRNLIHCLPESIKHLTKLDELLLNCCTELQMIPNLPIFSNSKEAFMTVSPFSRLIIPCFFFTSKQCGIFGCEKLTEVQDTFKLEPIENFGAEEIKRLFNVDSINKSQVQLYHFLIDRTRVATPQVLQECGITSTFVAGSEVPVGFMHISNEHQISFSLPKEKIHWFSLCIVFSIKSQPLDFLPSVCISNETKKMTWNYGSSFIGVPKRNGNTMLWLIHWPTTNFELEGGDLVSCTVSSIHLGIRKLGVTYESEENIAYQHGFTHSFPVSLLVSFVQRGDRDTFWRRGRNVTPIARSTKEVMPPAKTVHVRTDPVCKSTSRIVDFDKNEVLLRSAVGICRRPIGLVDLAKGLESDLVRGFHLMRFSSRVLLVFQDIQTRNRVLELLALDNWFDSVLEWSLVASKSNQMDENQVGIEVEDVRTSPDDGGMMKHDDREAFNRNDVMSDTSVPGDAGIMTLRGVLVVWERDRFDLEESHIGGSFV
ncbi:hypothetical protein V6N12_036462 [Hibiscus sabdariffa]|uniref:TMV resistance protein N-like n=1 Tax=Hibiscus sabdariffa TaxID=183260 RepID=A0ABR2ER56_9ROSI